MNVCAPSTASPWKQFWQDLLNVLPPLDYWCIVGDFNMIEDPIDRKGVRSTTIHGHELAIWEQLVFSLQLIDAWHAPLSVHTKASLFF